MVLACDLKTLNDCRQGKRIQRKSAELHSFWIYWKRHLVTACYYIEVGASSPICVIWDTSLYVVHAKQEKSIRCQSTAPQQMMPLIAVLNVLEVCGTIKRLKYFAHPSFVESDWSVNTPSVNHFLIPNFDCACRHSLVKCVNVFIPGSCEWVTCHSSLQGSSSEKSNWIDKRSRMESVDWIWIIDVDGNPAPSWTDLYGTFKVAADPCRNSQFFLHQ